MCHAIPQSTASHIAIYTASIISLLLLNLANNIIPRYCTSTYIYYQHHMTTHIAQYIIIYIHSDAMPVIRQYANA